MPTDTNGNGTTKPQGADVPTRLGWVSFFNDCSSETLARALPLFLVTSLGLTPTAVGAIEGIAEAVGIALRAFSGWLSDRMVSRKPLVILGYFFSFLSRVLLLFISVPLLFGATRVFDRVGKGLRSAPRDAMVADAMALGTAGRAFGIVRFLDTLGAVTGLGMALAFGLGRGPLTSEGFRSLVWLSLPFGLVSLLLLCFWVPRLPRVVRAKKYLSFTAPKGTRLYLAIVLLFSLGASSDAFLVLRARELGFDLFETFGLFLGLNVLAAALAIPFGKLSDRFGRIPVLVSGWLIYAASYALFAVCEEQWAFASAMALYGAFYGLTEGVEKAFLSDLVEPDERGRGFGAFHLVLGIAAFPSSLLTGWLMTRFGSGAAFLACAGLAVLASIILLACSPLLLTALRGRTHARLP